MDHVIRSVVTLVLCDGSAFREEVTAWTDGLHFLQTVGDRLSKASVAWLHARTEYIPAGHTIEVAVFNDGTALVNEFGSEYATFAHAMRCGGRKHPFLTRLLREACARNDDDIRLTLCGNGGPSEGIISLLLFAGKKYFCSAERCHSAFLFCDQGLHRGCLPE